MHFRSYASRIAAVGFTLAAAVPGIAVTSAKPVGAMLEPGARSAARAPQVAQTAGWYPLANGDTASFSIAETDTISYPSAPPTSNTYGYTGTDEDSCPVSFGPFTGLCDQQSVDTLDLGTVDDVYLGLFPVSGAQLVAEPGFVYVESSGGYMTTITASTSKPLILDELPEQAGNRWSDALFADITTLTTGPARYQSLTKETFDPRGGYSFTTKTTGPGKHLQAVETVRTKPDASVTQNVRTTGYNPLLRSFAVPMQVSGQPVIPVTTSGGNALPATPSPAQTVDVPDWYPEAAAPQRLFSDRTVDLGPASMPAACAQYAGAQAEHRQERYLQLDPLLGRLTTEIADYYDVFGSGTVCQTFLVTDSYYDQLQTGALIETLTEAIAETLADQTFDDLALRGLHGPRAGAVVPDLPAHARTLRERLAQSFARSIEPQR